MKAPADSVVLPAHARLVARDDVWLEGNAVQQFARVAALPGCVRAVGMPDLHAGRGIPVGAAFAFADRVVPQLIGGDAGCGVRLVATSVGRMAPDLLERRAREAMEDDPLAGCDPAEMFEQVWRRGARGLAEVDGVPEALARLAAAEPEDGLRPSGDPSPYRPYRAGYEGALGSVGGGNHFLEVARVGAPRDPASAAAIGLSAGDLVVVAHSGSRGLGGALGERWGAAVLEGDAAEPYLGELAGACRFARANRLLLAYRMLRALGATRASKIAGGFDIVHNDVAREAVGGEPAWVHRKGAAPARGDDFTIVLGSRGTPSWVMRSRDAEAGLRSVAHGAGRKMGRGEAREKIAARYRRRELARTELGGRVVCDDPALLLEEHPDAYKPIEPVVESLVEAGLATVVAPLVPVLTVKR
ncbi:RtcB family protein [Sorangium sp. So ce1097]|uniref:RtcB family protein n=1 Tax=Sorangium sp. So ce1097 TaxID=3133330 RepID=UPI003F6376EB